MRKEQGGAEPEKLHHGTGFSTVRWCSLIQTAPSAYAGNAFAHGKMQPFPNPQSHLSLRFVIKRIALNILDALLLLGFLGPSPCLSTHSWDAGQSKFPGRRWASQYFRLHPTISNTTGAGKRWGQLSASHDSWLGLLAGYSGHSVNANGC